MARSPSAASTTRQARAIPQMRVGEQMLDAVDGRHRDPALDQRRDHLRLRPRRDPCHYPRVVAAFIAAGQPDEIALMSRCTRGNGHMAVVRHRINVAEHAGQRRSAAFGSMARRPALGSVGDDLEDRLEKAGVLLLPRSLRSRQ